MAKAHYTRLRFQTYIGETYVGETRHEADRVRAMRAAGEKLLVREVLRPLSVATRRAPLHRWPDVL